MNILDEYEPKDEHKGGLEMTRVFRREYRRKTNNVFYVTLVFYALIFGFTIFSIIVKP